MSTPSNQLQLATGSSGISQVLRFAPSGQQIGLLLALAAAVTLAVGILMWASRPSMVPLHTAMGDAETRQVIDKLDAMGQRYEVTEAGMVLVPQDKLAELKLRIGADVLSSPDPLLGSDPAASGAFNTSEEERRQRRIRVLERELARTISQIQSITTARVHLAIPRRTVFIRDARARPSASVKLEIAVGRVLDAGQIAGIANLVATSVPHLEPGQVSIVDQHGQLLNRDLLDPMAELTNRQLAYKNNYEMSEASKIEQILSPIVGHGRVRVQMSARFDFSRVEQQETTYEADPKSVRSVQRMMQKSSGVLEPFGTPGALSNQPPEGGSVQEADAEAEAAAEDNGSFRREEIVNNEVGSRTVTTKGAPWQLARITVAVLVDDRIQIDEAGEVVRQPREQAELDTLTQLVKNSIGFDEARGDVVTVINQSFQPEEQLTPLPEPKLWEQTWFEPLLKTSLGGVALALLVLLVIRPTVRALMPGGARRAVAKSESGADDSDGEGDDSQELDADRLSLTSNIDELLPPPARVHGDILNLAREMAAQDPKRVASVLRKWMESDE